MHVLPVPGPSLTPGGCRFLVWAPAARNAVTLRLRGPALDVPMSPEEGGYWSADVPGVRAGRTYFYRLDDGPDRADPASRCQPDGVHGPSQVVSDDFDWGDDDYRGVPPAELVLYELHVGTFTREGTFDAAVGHLDRLRELGINTISIMPVAQFPGTRNWGYDGVYPFSVQPSYGGAAGLKRLVKAAHARGMGVVLDVVYNHLGPEGNYFHGYGPYFSDNYRTPWGQAINFDGPRCDAVRDYFLANALRFQDEFRLDGLRLDAVPFIKDLSAYHLLAELSDRCKAQEAVTGRRFHLIGESDLNDPRILHPRERNGHALSAQWSDDFHHALHAYLTGERWGYYADHGDFENIARAYADAFTLVGQFSHYRHRRYGRLPADCPGEQFVIFSMNHDQAGNRTLGDRLTVHLTFEQQKLVAALLLTTPYVPMLFMGEEYGETAPFPYFIDHGDKGLLANIRRSRAMELARSGVDEDMPDPGAESTYASARIDPTKALSGEGKALSDWHRELLRLRRTIPALSRLDRAATKVTCHAGEEVLAVTRTQADSAVWMLFAFGDGRRATVDVPAGRWRKVLDATGAMPAEVAGPGRVEVTGRAAVVYARA